MAENPRAPRPPERRPPAAGSDGANEGPFSFEKVFAEELAAIRRRQGEWEGPTPDAALGADVYEEAHRKPLTGLAISGGGIRSATFGLGVLQGMAHLGLLRFFDYLSTVSGGGYIGSWLVAWIHREEIGEAQAEEEAAAGGARDEVERRRRVQEAAKSGARALDRVSEGLVREIRSREEPAGESPIQHLRAYGSSLMPRLGAFSIESWTMIATYLRNLLLNLTILVMTVTALLLAPRLLLSWVLARRVSFEPVLRGPQEGVFYGPSGLPMGVLDPEAVEAAGSASRQAHAIELVFVAGFLLLVGIVFTSYSLDRADRHVPRRVTSTPVVMATVVGPIFAACLLTAVALPDLQLGEGDRGPLGWLAGFAYTVFWMAALGITLLRHLARRAWRLSGAWWRARRPEAGRNRRGTGAEEGGAWRVWIWALLMAALAGGVGGWVLWILARRLFGMSIEAAGSSSVAWLRHLTLGPPALVLVVLLVGVLHVGLMGRAFSEDRRQWWSRIGASLLTLSLGWVLFLGVSYYGPWVLRWLGEGRRELLSLGWVLLTLAGLLVGTSFAAARRGRRAVAVAGLVGKLAPYVFIAGLVTWLSDLAQRIQLSFAPAAAGGDTGPVFARFLSDRRPIGEVLETAVAANGSDTGALAWTIAGLLAGAWFLSNRVDVNEFSMHHFYRSRLARCFLGARRRKPNRFTDFDPDDDLDLAALDPGVDGVLAGPYPILNATLNEASGEQATRRERKASSFVFTPRYYGFDASGMAAGDRSGWRLVQRVERLWTAAPEAYRRTRLANRGAGIQLGTAMAISGAAVNPQMGYRSSPALTFLMTVFNARLGWWLGNPKHRSGWDLPGPRMALWTLLRELAGATSANSKYVSLSDGGFFDNLGLYELVRRRCRFVVVCDAEADPHFRFGALGNAIRRCRRDFGVEIDIHLDPIRRRDAEGHSQWHCAVGRILYSQVDANAPEGILVYLKASMTGDEPEDLLNYAVRKADFPHESTSDQQFDEAQFESYRMLGYHIAGEVFGAEPIPRPRRRRPPDKSEAAPSPGKGEAAPRASVQFDLHTGADEINIESVFVGLQQAWYPPSPVREAAFSRHAATLDRIFERLRTDPTLAYLDSQMFVELDEWRLGREMTTAGDRPRGEEKPFAERARDPNPKEFRAGFYLCNSMIQLMESVYLDLDLDQNWLHPDNRGWVNLFRLWVRTEMFRRTWSICAATYGARFQRFCERRLHLHLGAVRVEALGPETEAKSLTELVSRERARGRLDDLEADLIPRFAADLEIELDKGESLVPLEVGDVYLLRLELLSGKEAARLARLPRCRPRGRAPRPAGNEPALLSYTIGLAVARRVARRGRIERRALTFLRIRSHLRTLGLGRRSIFRLISEGCVDSVALPPNAVLSRIYRRVDQERFRALFRSAHSEWQLCLQGIIRAEAAAGDSTRAARRS